MENFLSIPKLGESVSEATIIKWLVSEGSIIEKDQPYVEVATDKVDSEVPSPYKCKLLKILTKENETVSVGMPIAEVEWLEEILVKEVKKEAYNSEKTEKPNVFKENSTITVSSEYRLSPLVKKIMYKNSIHESELKNIKGTGESGRITRDDIMNYIANRTTIIENQPVELHKKPMRLVQEANLESGDQSMPFDRMQALTAKHMLSSKQISAHCTSVIDIDVTAVVNWRNEYKDLFEKKYGVKLTFTHIFFKLIIESLKEFPKLNAHQYDDGIVMKKHIHLGFATSMEGDRLIVPVIRSAESMELIDIVNTVADLSNKAKSNALSQDDIQGGTFTVSNTGIFGSLLGTPIINQPQVAIVSLGEIQRVPTVIMEEGQEKIAIRSKMMASMSYDHRVINGAYASQFLSNFREKNIVYSPSII